MALVQRLRRLNNGGRGLVAGSRPMLSIKFDLRRRSRDDTFDDIAQIGPIGFDRARNTVAFPNQVEVGVSAIVATTIGTMRLSWLPA